jgi:hypothetical protein
MRATQNRQSEKGENMALKLKEQSEVWSKDGHRLGQAKHIFHRTEGVDPQLELYSQYLYVFSFDLGDDYYIPLDFIEEDEKHGRFTLNLTMDEAMAKGWSRIPDFVVQGQSTREELSDV